MKRGLYLSVFFLAGCATHQAEINRLSPILSGSKIPSECRVVSVLKDSPAEKVGIAIGDTLKAVNGQVPKDASLLSDIVTAAPQDSNFDIVRKDGKAENVKISLNASRPRLGTVCDLAGWEKLGVTVAGNESVTVFSGPFGLTASAIVDKSVLFMRIRLTNNLDKAIAMSPELFKAFDGSGKPLPLLAPKEVMCFLYGDKGAHLLALKKQHKETLDTAGSVAAEAGPEDVCPQGAKGNQAANDPQYVEANAEYMATESLWPTTTLAGGVADGLIYAKEPAILPLTLIANVEAQTLTAKLGRPKGGEKQMKPSELIQFFESQKRGNPLRLTLHKGKIFVGKFASYDPNEERVWFDTPSGALLRSTSYSIDYIRNAEPLEQIPPKPSPSSTDLN